MSELVAVVKFNDVSYQHSLYVSPRDFSSLGTRKIGSILKRLNFQGRARNRRDRDGINVPLTNKPNLNINVHEQSIRPATTRIKNGDTN